MAKSPRISAVEAEKLLLKSGFEIIRIKGSHKEFLRIIDGLWFPFMQATIYTRKDRVVLYRNVSYGTLDEKNYLYINT